MPSIDLTALIRLSARRVLPPESRIAVALSGGVDSVALLHALTALRGELALEVSAVHVNHGLSPNADVWESFCCAMCAALDVGFTAARLALVHTPGRSLEAQARSARYAALECAAAGSETGIIALAQHADDQAETVLLQLLRGAAAKGLAAMPEWRRKGNACGYWRPLLRATRRDIIEYARRVDLQWIEDESNADPAHKRNFLRGQVLPRLAEAFPGYRTSFARTAAHAADAAKLLDELADLDATAAVDGDRVPLAALRELGALRAGNLLRRMLAQRGHAVPPGERLAEFIRQALEAARDRHPMLPLERHHVLGADGGYVTIFFALPPEPFVAAWRGEPEVALPHGRLLFKEARGAGIRGAMIPATGLVIRSREGGERMRLALNRPVRTLKNLMQEAGVPAASRSRWPLILIEGRLAAVPGIGVDVDWQCPEDERGWGIEWRPGVPGPE